MPGIDSYTKLLLHFDGDQSTSEHTVTHVGAPEYRSDNYVFGTSSLWFDGSNDYLLIDDHSDWNFGNGNYTIDFRFNASALSNSTNYFLYSQSDSGGSNLHDIWIEVDGSGNKSIRWREATGGSQQWLVNASATLTTGTWYHVACVRNGSDFRIYLNGTSIGNTTHSNAISDFGYPVRIGASGYSSGSQFFSGYMEEFRVSKGDARWTTNFTPPTEAYTTDGNTSLLLHMNGDSSDEGHKVVPYDVKLNAATGVIDGSMYFDGSDYITIPDSDDWNFGTSNFTIDFRVRISNNSVFSPFIGASDQTEQIGWNNTGAGSNRLYIYNEPTNYVATTTSTITNNTWYHVAFVRADGVLYIFLDGVLQGSGVTMNTSFDLNGFNIGALGSNYFSGYMDEFHIEKGVARWTSNFTPPTEAYSADSGIYISGTKNNTARIVVIKESDWSIEYNSVISGTGPYEVSNLDAGKKTIFAVQDNGDVKAYGNVTPIYT